MWCAPSDLALQDGGRTVFLTDAECSCGDGSFQNFRNFRLTVPPLCTPLAYIAEVDPQTICVPYAGILYLSMPLYSAQGGSAAPLIRKLPHDLRQPLHGDHVR